LFDNRIRIVTCFSFYLNTLIEEQLETIDDKIKNKKSNWNTGYSFSLGINLDVSKHFYFGIGYE